VWLCKEGGGATSEEAVRSAKLTWERATYEALGKKEAVTLAERELHQAETVLRMHQLRATTPGVIKTIYKKPGEAVRSYEPVVQIHHLARLRVEGMVDVHLLERLHPGMRASVEPCQPVGPSQTLVGHLEEISSVAISSDSASIVSAGLDNAVRVWNRAGQQVRVLPHPSSVLAVTCTPPGSAANLCLSGALDGKARLWDLNGTGNTPLRELHGQHENGIVCVAFSPDAKTCATGGTDGMVRIWDVASGALRHESAPGGVLRGLQFTPRGQLLVTNSNRLQLMSVTETGLRPEACFEGRSGAVTQLGLSPDGSHVLYDQAGTLQLLSLPEGRTDGVVQNVPRGSSFAAFALFSPDARLVLTASAEGPVRLWRTPASTHAAEVRQLVAPDTAAATCAAFAPDGSFVAIGSRDRRLRLWPVPSAEEAERRLTAEVTFIDRAVESSTHEARIWAELPNTDGRLLPGTTVTLVLDGEER